VHLPRAALNAYATSTCHTRALAIVVHTIRHGHDLSDHTALLVTAAPLQGTIGMASAGQGVATLEYMWCALRCANVDASVYARFVPARLSKQMPWLCAQLGRLL
jgi:hypothetical protein